MIFITMFAWFFLIDRITDVYQNYSADEFGSDGC